MEKQAGRSLMQWLDKAAYILLAIILFDCMALGGGCYLRICGIDIRMIWYALFFLLSLPIVLKNIRKLLANGYVLTILIWLVWLAVCTVKGFRAGNDRANIIAGLIGFASFGILPGALAVVTTKKRILTMMKIAVAAAGFLALQTIALAWLHNIDGLFLVRINPLFLEMELGALSIVDEDLVRVFMRSHPLTILGCGCAVYFYLKSAKKWHRLGIACVAAFGLMSLVLSYTRSLYLALAVAIGLLFVLCVFIISRQQRKRLINGIGVTASIFLLLLISLNVLFGTSLLSYGIYRATGYDPEESLGSDHSEMMQVDLTPGGMELLPTEEKPESTKDSPQEPSSSKPKPSKPAPESDEKPKPTPEIDKLSDDLRAATRKELMTKIREHPLLGSGMGTVLEIREDIDGVNEYFYLDLTMKTGLIGVVLYLLPIVLMFLYLLFGRRYMNSDDVLVCAVWLSALLGVAIFSYFNPYMNGSNGIVLYSCAMAVMSKLNGKQQVSFKNKN